MGANETRLRTLARSLTWRLSGVVLAVLLTWYLTGDMRTGIEVGVAYNVIRFATQYIHDRWWARVAWGALPGPEWRARSSRGTRHKTGDAARAHRDEAGSLFRENEG